MAWPKLLVLVRHAESEGNVLSVAQRANLDTATYAYKLTERGRKQAKITSEFLRKKIGLFDVYYVSYYERSKETMRIMYPKARVYEDPRLAEGQRGIWHVLTKKQVARKFPWEIIRKEREGLYHYRPWGGENWPDIELRIHSFLGTLSRDCEDKKVIIVVHGHWLILFQKLIHHFSIEEALKKQKADFFKNASLTIYEGKNKQSRLILKEENFVPWEGKI